MSKDTDEFFDQIVKARQKTLKEAIKEREDQTIKKKNNIIEQETNDKLEEMYILQATAKTVSNTVKIKFNVSDNIYLFRTKKPQSFIKEVVKALKAEEEPKQDWLKIERAENHGRFTTEDLINKVKFF